MVVLKMQFGMYFKAFCQFQKKKKKLENDEKKIHFREIE